MPYEGEFAHYGPLRRVLQNERVLRSIRDLQIEERSSKEAYQEAIGHFQRRASAPQSSGSITKLIAIDGSHLDVPIQNGYPQAEVSCITLAAVLIDLDRIAELDEHRPIDPAEFRKTEQASSMDAVIPGCNVVLRGHANARESVRTTLYTEMELQSSLRDSESMLGTYESLLKQRSTTSQIRCPIEGCPSGPNATVVASSGMSLCGCEKAARIYSTDALRIHEGMSLEGSNGAMYNEIMQVWERLWLIEFLRALERQNNLWIMERVAVVLDGPLALFGHPAWLSQVISDELMRLNRVLFESTGKDLLLIGIEKTGQFVDHFENLDHGPDGPEAIQPQSYLLLTDDYIKQHVIFSTSDKQYGKDTYFGRKLFYKTRGGAKLVMSLPFLDDVDRDTGRAEVSQFPRLCEALDLMDRVASTRYMNAVSPLISAHAEAAIPLNLGSKVLENLARELMQEQ